MDQGEDVVLGDAFGDEDRVLEVVALPRHERDEHVLAERELAHVGRRTVRQDLARADVLARSNDGLLVVASGLVAPLVLEERVDVRQVRLVAVGADDDARRVDALDRTVATREDAHTAVAGELALHAGADVRRVRPDEGNRLALHVGAHESAVRVVVLEERNERSGDRHHLVGSDVHELDHVGRDHVEVAVEARRDEGLAELALLVDGRCRHADVLALFFEGAEPRDVVGDAPALGETAIGRLHEAELVDAGVGRQRRDEADVRTFRRLDGADASVVRRVDVAHLEPCALAGETAGPERRETTLVRHFRQRVRLVHELREL